MEKRNILLITADSLRWDSISDMPHLENFADNNIRFHRAYTNGPSTPFSFPSLFNLNYDPIRDPISIREPTLTASLKGQGYRTLGLVASNPYISAISGYQQGFDIFEDFITSQGREVRSKMWTLFQKLPEAIQDLRDIYRCYFKKDITSAWSGKIITEMSKRWLSTLEDEPFFFWVHFMDTHYPYTPPLSHTDLSIGEIISLNNFRKERTLEESKDSKNQVDDLKLLYSDACSWLDHQLSEMFENLKCMGIWDSTDIVVTSDHGEGFGEHGFLGHPSQLYEEVVKIPIIAKLEEISSDKRNMVEMRDIPSTFSRMERGIDFYQEDNDRFIPFRARHAGNRSCMKEGMNLINRPESLDYGIYGCVTRRYKLIYDEEDEKIELYDLQKDPDEEMDISYDNPDIVKEFKKKLDIR